MALYLRAAFLRSGEVRDQVETIRRELMSLPDIGKTTLLGEQEQIVSLFLQRLAGMGLNIQQIADALRAQMRLSRQV